MLQGPIEHDHEDPLRQKVVRVLVSQKGDAVQPNRRLTAACPALKEDGSRIRLGDRPKLFTADEGRDLGEAVILGLFFPADSRFGSGSSPGPVFLPDEENSPSTIFRSPPPVVSTWRLVATVPVRSCPLINSS